MTKLRDFMKYPCSCPTCRITIIMIAKNKRIHEPWLVLFLKMMKVGQFWRKYLDIQYYSTPDKFSVYEKHEKIL